tara:strand:- start:9545 stop:10783 length:1239 start_codon:yes stop_codon:yes gene_type:complete
MSSNNCSNTVAVIGAGAAGLLAAVTAARAGANVILIERTSDGGRKILISGGGRCNILPGHAQPQLYVTDSSPNTLRKILRSWPLHEQRAFFEHELGMPLELEPETGKLFPASNRARDVRDILVARIREAGASIWFEASVVGLQPDSGQWQIELENAPSLTAACVVLATGGLSVPKTGSDGTGLNIAEALGHTVHPTYPALTPLIADPHPHASLAGISLTVSVNAPGSRPAFSTTNGLLVTHDGWSGPSILDASHLAIRGKKDGSRQELTVQWAQVDAYEWDQKLQAEKGTVRSTISSLLPRRLADQLISEAEVDGATRLSQLRKGDRKSVVETLTQYAVPWTGDAGYKKAEVTGGGVSLSEVHPATMESTKCPGLYLCGEILDAFGPIGGHNFLWAWATGRSAGMNAAAQLA